MFDEEDYQSDEQQQVIPSHKSIASSNVLAPSSTSDFNHLTGDSQSLLKIMKERGFDLSDNQLKKAKQKALSNQKTKEPKQKAGFFDGGVAATIQQLIKALNKALKNADPQQANCILSYILQKKNLSVEDLNKFGVMKCKILFGLGSYKDCQAKAQQLIQKAQNKIKMAIFSNYLAKSKSQTNKILQGYTDLLRAKSLIRQVKQHHQKHIQSQMRSKQEQNKFNQGETLLDTYFNSEIQSVIRQIDYTQLQYNIKLAQLKNSNNMIFPHYPQFRGRQIKQLSCGDFHAIFLVQGLFEKNCKQSTLPQQWKSEVFGIGQNGVGQLLGNSNTIIYKQPILITQLSGKGIKGVYATKQTSLAFNIKGEIYQWGVKNDRNQKISITASVGEQIKHLQKGNKHYALLTASNKFYTWGDIQSRGAVVYKQANPLMQPNNNVTSFSCGNSCIICVDSLGQAYAMGNNEFGQITFNGQYFSKTFRKIQSNMLGSIRKAICVGDCSFFINKDQEVYFCGKYSYSKEAQLKLRQAEFSGQIRNLISLCGHTGTYYATNEVGQLFKWSVEQNMKFRQFKQKDIQVYRRFVQSNKGTLFQIKNLLSPKECTLTQITKAPKSYEPIQFQLVLKDQYGLFGNQDFFISPRCQIFLATYQSKREQVLKENQEFLSRFKMSTNQNRILLSQIIQSRTLGCSIIRDQNQPWLCNLQITVDTAGRYIFYVLLDHQLIYQHQLKIQVSDKQNELSQKNVLDKKQKQQQRRRKLQEEKQRLLEQKLRKQEQEEQKKRQTQKRAEETLKKYMKEQQELKMKQAQDRRARKQLQTGGGFDLNKLKPKKSIQLKKSNQAVTSKIENNSELKYQVRSQFMTNQIQKMSQTTKSKQSFLPDINVRPGSKRKITLGVRNQSLGSSKIINPLQKTTNQTGFLQAKTRDIGKTTGIEFSKNPKMDLTKSINSSIKTTSTVGEKGLLKRGLSNRKK